MTKRTVHVSVLLEFTLDVDDEDDELIVTTIQKKFASAIRPEWKGLHMPGTLIGTFASKANWIDVTIGHDIYDKAPVRRSKKKR